MTLYEKVQGLCAARGISIYKACKDLGFSKQTIGNWKSRPDCEPSLKVGIAMADYFNVDVKMFLNS